MITCNVMADVARQDAARACLGLGDEQRAIQHLRLASRVSPPARRAFHLWTLGSVLYLNGKPRGHRGTCRGSASLPRRRAPPASGTRERYSP
jgi:hypothetical protein